MTMDENRDVHTTTDRDPVERVDDPEYRSRLLKTIICCCEAARRTCLRRLYVAAGLIALLIAAVLFAIFLYYDYFLSLY